MTCSDNTYASSGAVLAFNPSAAGETFDRSIPTEVDMGPVQWNVLDNGGVTLVSKLKFSASPSNYERVFAATDSATVGNALFQIMRRAETEAMFFIINDGDTSCLSDDIPITNEQWVTMLFQYDAATANIMVQLDGGTKHYKDCSAVAGFSAQNRLQNVNIFGRHGGSSPHFNGAIAGFYGFNSLLTSAQASLVLDSIVVGGDDTSAPLECTPCPTDGTVVTGCSASPCPTGLIAQYQFDGDDSNIELAYGGVPPADKWSWDAAGVHFTCNDANYFGTESVPVHESGDYDAACLQGGNSAWLQLDLGESMFVTGIVTQGRPDWDQYVTRYTVQGSIDDITWIDMPCKNVDSLDRCIGSSDRSTKVTNEFAQVVNVRYVKLFVKDYHVYASLRMSVYKSDPVIVCSETTESGETDSDVPCCSRTWPD